MKTNQTKQPVYTPGPWKVCLYKGPDTGNCSTYYLENTQGGEYGEEAEANARLIAAAPEMLEELKNLVLLNEVKALPHAYPRIKALIAKAEGR